MTFEEELANAIEQGTCANCDCDINDFANAIMPIIDKWCFRKPVFDDGEPVQFGDEFYIKGVQDNKAFYITFHSDGSFAVNCFSHGKGKCVERPKPQVIAADGKPLEIGETVYEIETGIALKITNIFKDYLEYEIGEAGGFFYEKEFDKLTHTKPVFDADGVVVRKGDWVYYDGMPFYVNDIYESGNLDLRIGKGEYDGIGNVRASIVTHKKPEIDTLERIREDATLPPRKYYNDHIGHDVGLRDDEQVFTRVHLDLIERAVNVMERDGR